MTSRPAVPESITVFQCGPIKCQHDYSGWRDITEDGKVIGGTAVCVKCWQSAYEEAQWL